MSVLKAALLGRSLSHSISPAVHGALFPIVRQKLKSVYDSIDYENIECADEKEFASCVLKGKDLGYVGFNVTFPYKYAALSLLKSVSTEARSTNSINTILCGDEPRGISTDGLGFLSAMQKSLPNIDASQFNLLILGVGGAARAVYSAIASLGWRKSTVAARSVKEAQRSFPQSQVDVLDISATKRQEGRYFVIQCTPVGQRSSESLLERFPWSADDVAADLVYNPLRTKFLDIAANQGARTIDGLGMLIEQAALSQYLWMTGKESDRSILTPDEFRELHHSLSKLVSPRWDAFGI